MCCYRKPRRVFCLEPPPIHLEIPVLVPNVPLKSLPFDNTLPFLDFQYVTLSQLSKDIFWDHKLRNIISKGAYKKVWKFGCSPLLTAASKSCALLYSGTVLWNWHSAECLNTSFLSYIWQQMRGLFSSNNEYDHQSYVTAFKALLFKLSGIKLLPMEKHIFKLICQHWIGVGRDKMYENWSVSTIYDDSYLISTL